MNPCRQCEANIKHTHEETKLKLLILIRGLPGSGKSTLAQLYIADDEAATNAGFPYPGGDSAF